MDKSTYWVIAFMVALGLMLIWLLIHESGQSGLCKGKGGVYVSETCIKPEAIISLEEQ